MGEWKPIESAPKDGTHVDGWAVNTVTGKPVGRFTNMWWEHDAWQCGTARGFYWDIEAPINAATGQPVVKLSHWQPLPAPPSQEEG
jgi:hypothetical protein